MKSDKNVLKKVEQYYSRRISEHGATPKGVDWNGAESQELRFKTLSTLFKMESPFSLNDIGCGYGGLFEYLEKSGRRVEYFGSDVSELMCAAAKKNGKGKTNCHIVSNNDLLPVSDYSVASGIFNVKLESPTEVWKEYVLGLLQTMNHLSNVGFAFNMLTSYSDLEKRQERLFYADPSYYFDLCKRTFSRNVSLLHDYDLYEFTILVRKR